MSSSKKGFVCQNCGRNVPPSADRCPHCGRFFKGVRCPECLFVGSAEVFLKGCPSCGYLSDKIDMKSGQGEMFGKSLKPEKDFPAWVYFLSIGILAVLIGILAAVLFNMQ